MFANINFMEEQMKKLISTLLIAASLFSVAACGNSEKAETTEKTAAKTEEKAEKTTAAEGKETDATKAEGNTAGKKEPGALPVTDEPVTLRVFYQQEPQVLDFEDNKLTKYLEEQTNVKIEWDLVLSKDKTQKLNLLLATGESLPDVFMGGMDTSLLVEHAAQGTFVALDEYIANDSLWFKEAMSEFPDMEKLMTMPDGHIYALPNINMSEPNMMPSHLWMNQKWLEAVEMDVPTTTEELKEVLTAFKNDDPNGNGKADEIPLMGAINGWSALADTYILNSFLQYPTDGNGAGSRRFIVEDGKVVSVFTQDGYKQGIQYMNELVNEGLLDASTFTQDSQQMKQIFENPDTAILGSLTAGGPNTFADMSNSDRFRDYIAIPPVKGPDGVQLTAYNPYGYFNTANCWVITSACENPEAAFRLGDYFFSEEISMWGRLGEPGTDYIPNPDGKKAVDGGDALFEAILIYGSEQKSHWQNRNPYYNFFDNKGVASDDPYALQDLLWDTMLVYREYTPAPETCIPPLVFSSDEAEEYNEINSALVQYVDETRVRFITSGGVEEEWDSYLQELDNIGLPRMMEIVQIAYERFING